MKKRILFPLVCLMLAMLTSCFEETGYSYSASFSRIVTIDTMANPIKMKADCTGETFSNFTNLKYPEQLSMFGLENARRAEVAIQLNVATSGKQILTMLQGHRIGVSPVTNTTITDSLMHFSGLSAYYNNYAWVNEGYLNVMPIIPSSSAGRYFLTPESAQGDTLYFNLDVTYNKAQTYYYDKLQCFDLRTIRDTTTADEELRIKMRNVLNAMEAHQSDSMRIVLKGNYATKSQYTGKDTIVHANMAMTNYFHYNF